VGRGVEFSSKNWKIFRCVKEGVGVRGGGGEKEGKMGFLLEKELDKLDKLLFRKMGYDDLCRMAGRLSTRVI
jgi:hypothetical protein